MYDFQNLATKFYKMAKIKEELATRSSTTQYTIHLEKELTRLNEELNHEFAEASACAEPRLTMSGNVDIIIDPEESRGC